MTDADLRRLQTEGAILDYEVLEQDRAGNILELRLRLYPHMEPKIPEAVGGWAGLRDRFADIK
jgi:hypothetical protein